MKANKQIAACLGVALALGCHRRSADEIAWDHFKHGSELLSRHDYNGAAEEFHQSSVNGRLSAMYDEAFSLVQSANGTNVTAIERGRAVLDEAIRRGAVDPNSGAVRTLVGIIAANATNSPPQE